ncbi:helix-turn-helix domain-containing protein [Parasphingorhabdus sp.]|uniref:helix-turn-helix domain-containing protein n=1 Tax=Parasphingorhabdus sp. TaxID=2709688 RepID=UPI003D268E41
MKPILVSINETAKLLGLGRTSIYALINSGKLETAQIGRRNLVKMESIEKLANVETAISE